MSLRAIAAVWLLVLAVPAAARDARDFLDDVNGRSGWRTIDSAVFVGVFNGPDDVPLLKERYADRFGAIYASSPDGSAFDILRAPLVHAHVDAGNPELPDKLHVKRLDAHSQGVDYVLNALADGKLRCDELTLWAPPGGQSPGYTSWEKVQHAIAKSGAKHVRIFINANDPITFAWFPPVEVTATGGESVGLGWKFLIGGGGTNTPVDVYVVHQNWNRDQPPAARNGNVTRHDVHGSRGGHGLDGYLENEEELERPVTVVTTATGLAVLTEELLQHHAGATKGIEWREVQDKDGWVLVGPSTEPRSRWVAILVTKEDEDPAAIAAKIKARNDAEHPDQRAIVLLDGDPTSARNKALAAALEGKGYGNNDVLVVWNGNLYTPQGRLVAKGESFFGPDVRGDRVLAQGAWGNVLSTVLGRPVYGDPSVASAETNAGGAGDDRGRLGGVDLGSFPKPVVKSAGPAGR